MRNITLTPNRKRDAAQRALEKARARLKKRRAASQRALEELRARAAPPSAELEPAEQLAIAAGRSLGLSINQVDQACEELFYGAERTELADMVEARVLELLDLSGYNDPQAREALELRKGAEFFARVAAMGKPASAALWMVEKPIRALVALVVALVIFFWPSAVKAQSERVLAVREAHKIQRRNSAGLLLKSRENRHHSRRRGWIRSKNYYATSARRSRSCRAFVTGCAAEHVSCRRLARRSRSSWSGASGASASGAYRVPIPTSQLSAPTARSSARLGATQAKGAANANA